MPVVGRVPAMMRVMVVDDSAVIVDFLSTVLTEAGHEAMGFESAKAAMQRLETETVDLVVSDMHMPEMDGFEFTKAIRHHETQFAVPVILLTADSSPEFTERCRQAGVTGWLKKPVRPDELERQLRRFAVG